MFMTLAQSAADAAGGADSLGGFGPFLKFVTPTFAGIALLLWMFSKVVFPSSVKPWIEMRQQSEATKLQQDLAQRDGAIALSQAMTKCAENNAINERTAQAHVQIGQSINSILDRAQKMQDAMLANWMGGGGGGMGVGGGGGGKG